MPGNVEGQLEQDLEQPGLMGEVSLPVAGGLQQHDVKRCSNPNHSRIP